jgi:hypothetical protein
VLADYARLLDPLLDDGTTRVRGITDSGLVGPAQSFESLTRAVEAVALQQSLLTPVLARGAFDPASRPGTAVALDAEQAALRRNVNDVFVNLGRPQPEPDHPAARPHRPGRGQDRRPGRVGRPVPARPPRHPDAPQRREHAGDRRRRLAPPVGPPGLDRERRAGGRRQATDYTRVDIERLVPVSVLGSGVSDISHLLAELVDNALAYSPPTERVVVTGRGTRDGRYVLSVIDAGLGMPADRMDEANARISDPPVRDFAVSRFLGLYVVGRLADRHGVEVTLAPSPLGGVTAHVILSAQLLTAAPAGAGAPAPPAPVVQPINGQPTSVGPRQTHG